MSARIYDRRAARSYEEKQFMRRELEFLYGTAAGRSLLGALVSRPWFSSLYTLRTRTKSSTSKIKAFVEEHDICLKEFEQREFLSLNDFFTRDFAKGKRPVDPSAQALIAPCDGKLSLAQVSEDSRLYIKGCEYSLAELVGGSGGGEDAAAVSVQVAGLAERFSGGHCLVFRLSVDDGHRYIFFDDGELCDSWELPGRLHTVGPMSDGRVKVLAKNHRICQLLLCENFGEVLMIEVGALLVGRIRNHPLQQFKKGQEKGYFEYGGSTIVLVFRQGAVDIAHDILQVAASGCEIRVLRGECIGVRAS